MAVTPGDIAVELGRTAPDSTSPEFRQWEQWIADALFLISKRLGPVSELDADTVDYVVRQAVAAHARRPDDATQVAVSVDDGQMSKTYRSAKGRVEIIDEWWELLSPADTANGAFSIRPHGSGSGHAPWCDLMYPFKGADCSCGYSLSLGPWIYEPEYDL